MPHYTALDYMKKQRWPLLGDQIDKDYLEVSQGAHEPTVLSKSSLPGSHYVPFL